MSAFSIVSGQLIQFFLMVLAGFLLARGRLIRESGLRDLSMIITKLLLPMYIFHSCYTGNTRAQLLEGWPVLALTAGMYLALMVLFQLLSRVLSLNPNRAGAFQAVFVFGNIGFIGIPLIQALYPEEGMLYVALFSIVDQLFLWTCGIWMAGNAGTRRIRIRNFLNPALIAVLLALAGIMTGLRLPAVLSETVRKTGSAATAVCMIYLGALLFFSDLKGLWRKKELRTGIAVKMILFPLLVRIVLLPSGLPADMKGTMTLIAALPTMTIIPMLVKNGGGDSEYAAGFTMITLIASMFTLPLIALIAL